MPAIGTCIILDAGAIIDAPVELEETVAVTDNDVLDVEPELAGDVGEQ